MSLIALLAFGLVVTAAFGFYRIFSYLAAAFILAIFPAASIERGDRELDLGPYTELTAGLTILFGIGLTGIWLLWNPSVMNYTYVLGLPQSTVVYMLFLWLLPLFGAIYYATTVFARTGSDEIVEDIMNSARQAQRRNDLPLAPSGSSDSTKSDGETER